MISKTTECKSCLGFGLVETDNTDPQAVYPGGPAWPAWKFCACREGQKAAKKAANSAKVAKIKEAYDEKVRKA